MFVLKIEGTDTTLILELDFAALGPQDEPNIPGRIQSLFDKIPGMVARGNETKQRRRDAGMENVGEAVEVPTTREAILAYLQPADYGLVGLELIDTISNSQILSLD